MIHESVIRLVAYPGKSTLFIENKNFEFGFIEKFWAEWVGVNPFISLGSTNKFNADSNSLQVLLWSMNCRKN